jgi:hypothetical protein
VKPASDDDLLNNLSLNVELNLYEAGAAGEENSLVWSGSCNQVRVMIIKMRMPLV